jgi:hypothetical protein
MKSLLLSALVVLSSLSVQAQQPDDKTRNAKDQLIRQRAVEAVLWSMPAMSDVFFREALFRDFGM